MAFALDAIVAGTTYSLSDGNPFSLEGATGLAMAPVRRLTEQAPRQDGDTDLGYRLDPRTITLSLNFTATSYSDLDTNRDTLATIFKPAHGYDVRLVVTRDDTVVRQIDCQTVGPVDIALLREERAGRLHRAVVQLRAAGAVWYGATAQGTVLASVGGGTPVLGTIVYAGDYYSPPYFSLAGSVTSPVLTNVTTGKVLDLTGVTIAATETLIIDFVTKQVTRAGSAVPFVGNSDLGTWRLAPDPVATGGTNVLRVTAASSGTAAQLSLSYYDKFVSY